MSIELRVAGKDEQDKWDAIVEVSKQGTIFHNWNWMKIVEKHTKSKLYPIIGFKGTTIIGIYPLFYQKKFSFKSVFSPPPKVAVPYLGPVIVDYNKLKQRKKESIFIEFQKKVDEFIKSELKPYYTLISSPPNLPDSRPFKWTGYQVEPKYNYIIDLSKGENYVWEQFKRNLRNDISRAKSREIFVESGFKEEIEWIYDAIAMRYIEQSRVVPISKKYLLDLHESFYPQNMKIFVAKYNETVIGGIINIYYKNKITNWLGNTRANVGGISPNELLHWNAIKWAIEHDLKYYELIGANTERLCHYKSKYNPDLSICFSAKKYSSIMSEWAETAYFNILKPVSEQIKLIK